MVLIAIEGFISILDSLCTDICNPCVDDDDAYCRVPGGRSPFQSIKCRIALTIKVSNFLPDVAVIVVLLKIENRVARRAVTSVVEFENALVLVCSQNRSSDY